MKDDRPFEDVDADLLRLLFKVSDSFGMNEEWLDFDDSDQIREVASAIEKELKERGEPCQSRVRWWLNG